MPFWSAFTLGFESIEVDVILKKDELFVAHSRLEIDKARTLESLYLSPLNSAIEQGFFQKDQRLQILIDIKTEAYSTLDKVIQVINKYPQLKDEPRIQFVISGSRPEVAAFRNYPDYISFDYQNLKFTEELPLDKIGLVSISFQKVSNWNGKQVLKDADREKIQHAIDNAHKMGKPFRFWANPDTEISWKTLHALGVDYLNTDMIPEAAAFASEYQEELFIDKEQPPATERFSLMSFNIRYDNPNDKENWWGYRKDELAEMVQYYAPSILGIQEGLNHQVEFLDSVLTDYQYAGVGRNDGQTKGEYTAIFYNRKQAKLLSTETFWLSETPDKISIGWDASMERITTYGEFELLETGDTIHVFNAHFDHIGELSRLNAAKLLLKLVEEKELLAKNVVIMGDLNCLPTHAPIQVLREYFSDPFSESEKLSYGPLGTWNGFDKKLTIKDRIDYILVRNIQVNTYTHLDDRRKNSLYLSDHLPVFVR